MDVTIRTTTVEHRELRILSTQCDHDLFVIPTFSNNFLPIRPVRPPLWSSGQSFWLQIQRSRVRSPALPDFLSSSGSGTGWASWGQLRSYLNEKSSGSRSRKQRLTAVGNRCADHVTPLDPRKLALTSPTGGGRSVGIVRVRTKATEFFFPTCTDLSFW